MPSQELENARRCYNIAQALFLSAEAQLAKAVADVEKARQQRDDALALKTDLENLLVPEVPNLETETEGYTKKRSQAQRTESEDNIGDLERPAISKAEVNKARVENQGAAHSENCDGDQEGGNVDTEEEMVVEKRAKRSHRKTTITLSDEQQANLDGAEVWLEDMNDFLLHVPHGKNLTTVSAANARLVMRQVRALASGAGVGYQHWPSDVVFANGRPIDLSTNLSKLYKEAVRYEKMYGRDLGNGWLLRHPINKMKCYREHEEATTQNKDVVARHVHI